MSTGTGPCAEILKFNISGVAGFYSQLAGVLAGLAFAALIFLVSARLDVGRSNSTSPGTGGSGHAHDVSAALGSAYRMLLSSFVALTVSSLGYAVLGGSTVSGGRAATEEVVLAVAFSLAGGMLFYAVVLTLDVTEKLSSASSELHASTFARDVLAVIVAPLVMVYTSLGLTDYTDVRYGHAHGWSFLEVLGIGGVILQVTVSWIAYPTYNKYHRRSAPSSENLIKSTSILGWTFLAIVFTSVVGFGVIDAGSSDDPCTTLSPAIPTAAFLATAFSTLMLTTQVARFRTTKPQTLSSSTERDTPARPQLSGDPGQTSAHEPEHAD